MPSHFFLQIQTEFGQLYFDNMGSMGWGGMGPNKFLEVWGGVGRGPLI